MAAGHVNTKAMKVRSALTVRGHKDGHSRTAGSITPNFAVAISLSAVARHDATPYVTIANRVRFWARRDPDTRVRMCFVFPLYSSPWRFLLFKAAVVELSKVSPPK
ncbi:hypothetical protein EVAR_33595_1 [Eumeta japonica]|uniref:Uncharacterized protein n=1 Tax=Eumeta variegata TaxID=151549 RepID=A0A4C1WBP1_EUMVA|nr:hypothetical protein EVAR_33595_1 [Eumeta japonica]